MTLDQVLTVEAIVLKGSFKAASDFLFKSQPSVSMAIKKLEEEYQIQLFKRDEYRPTLTHEGKIFYQKAKLLLKEYRELTSLLEQMNKGEETELRISIDAISPVSSILVFLRTFFNHYPQTKLSLSFEVLNGTLERLLDHEADIAITPKPSSEDGFESLFFTKAKMVSVISTSLVKDKKITDLFLKEHNQIILADSARRLPKKTTGVLEGGKNITVTDVYFKKELIKQGLGWGGMPYDLVKDDIRLKKLTVIKTPLVKDREFDIYILRNLNEPMGPVTKSLWEKIKGSKTF